MRLRGAGPAGAAAAGAARPGASGRGAPSRAVAARPQPGGEGDGGRRAEVSRRGVAAASQRARACHVPSLVPVHLPASSGDPELPRVSHLQRRGFELRLQTPLEPRPPRPPPPQAFHLSSWLFQLQQPSVREPPRKAHHTLRSLQEPSKVPRFCELLQCVWQAF